MWDSPLRLLVTVALWDSLVPLLFAVLLPLRDALPLQDGYALPRPYDTPPRPVALQAGDVRSQTAAVHLAQFPARSPVLPRGDVLLPLPRRAIPFPLTSYVSL